MYAHVASHVGVRDLLPRNNFHARDVRVCMILRMLVCVVYLTCDSPTRSNQTGACVHA